MTRRCTTLLSASILNINRRCRQEWVLVITPSDIRQKAARLYLPFLRAWLQEEKFFPLDLPVGKLPKDYLALRKAARDLQSQSKEQRGFGYTLEYQVQQKRAS